jgi:hypothetical protein
MNTAYEKRRSDTYRNGISILYENFKQEQYKISLLGSTRSDWKEGVCFYFFLKIFNF